MRWENLGSTWPHRVRMWQCLLCSSERILEHIQQPSPQLLSFPKIKSWDLSGCSDSQGRRYEGRSLVKLCFFLHICCPSKDWYGSSHFLNKKVIPAGWQCIPGSPDIQEPEAEGPQVRGQLIKSARPCLKTKSKKVEDVAPLGSIPSTAKKREPESDLWKMCENDFNLLFPL